MKSELQKARDLLRQIEQAPLQEKEGMFFCPYNVFLQKMQIVLYIVLIVFLPKYSNFFVQEKRTLLLL